MSALIALVCLAIGFWAGRGTAGLTASRTDFRDAVEYFRTEPDEHLRPWARTVRRMVRKLRRHS